MDARHPADAYATVNTQNWYRCLRALNLRVRGIYTCKDTFVSVALRVRRAEWVVDLTGVRYDTLKKHYAKWMPDDEDRAEQRRLTAAFAAPSDGELPPHHTRLRGQSPEARENEDDSECEEGA